MPNPKRPNLLEKIDPILERYGLILESDLHLPSVVSTIIGESIHGSWWGHPQGNRIYQTLGILSRRPNFLLRNLPSGKQRLSIASPCPKSLQSPLPPRLWRLTTLSLNL